MERCQIRDGEAYRLSSSKRPARHGACWRCAAALRRTGNNLQGWAGEMRLGGVGWGGNLAITVSFMATLRHTAVGGVRATSVSFE